MERKDIFAKLDEAVAGDNPGAQDPEVPPDEVAESETGTTDSTRRIHHLEAALERRTVIGQATGMVMERYGIDAKAAFGVLARISSHTNRKIHAIAEELVEKRHTSGL